MELESILQTAANAAYSLLEMPLATAKAKIVKEENAGNLEWCGFTQANIYKQAGADPKITSAYFASTQGLLSFASYYTLAYESAHGNLVQLARPGKVSMIKDGGSFVNVRDYHEMRESMRTIILFDEIAQQTPLDIRAGDIVLFDHSGQNGPDHIQLVYDWNEDTRTLIVIDGNGGGFAFAESSTYNIAIKPNELSKDRMLLQDKADIVYNFVGRDIVYPSGGGRVGITCHRLVPEHQVTFNETKGAHARIWAIIRPSIVDFERHEYKNL